MSEIEVKEMIQKRRAVFPKQMSGGKVPSLVLDQALEAANWAPTHRRTEPWRFRVYSGKSMERLLDQCKECYVRSTPAESYNHAKVQKIELRKKQVSHIIAVCMQRHEVVPEWEEVAATSMAVQNLWLSLSATNLYGGYWSTPAYTMEEDFATFLRLEEDERCFGLFYIGEVSKDTQLPEGQRGDWSEKVEFNS